MLRKSKTVAVVTERLHLHQAQRTDLSPSKQFHNLPEVPSHGSSCTLLGPYAVTTNKYQRIISTSILSRIPFKKMVAHLQSPTGCRVDSS